MIVTPAIILIFFTIFSVKNFAFSGGEDGDSSDVDIDWSECPAETGPVDDNGDEWCEAVNASLAARFDPVSCELPVGDSDISCSNSTCRSNSSNHAGVDPPDGPGLEG
jgi:hypothetical protein